MTSTPFSEGDVLMVMDIPSERGRLFTVECYDTVTYMSGNEDTYYTLSVVGALDGNNTRTLNSSYLLGETVPREYFLNGKPTRVMLWQYGEESGIRHQHFTALIEEMGAENEEWIKGLLR